MIMTEYLLTNCLEKRRLSFIDFFKGIKVFTIAGNKLALRFINYHVEFVTAIMFVNENFLVCSDSSGNILMLQVKPNKLLEIVSGFSIGNEIINCIKKVENVRTNGDTVKEQMDNIYFATSKGRIGVIIELTEIEYRILLALEEIIISNQSEKAYNELSVKD